MRKSIFVLLSLLVVFSLFGEKYDRAEWRKLTKKFRRAILVGDWESFRELTGQIAADDSARAAELLLGAVESVSSMEDYDALKYALAALKSTNARNVLERALTKSKNQNARMLIIKVYVHLKDTKKIPLLAGLLESKKENPLILRAVCEALGEMGDKSAILPLIGFLERIEKERGDVPLKGTDWLEAVKALKRLTGVEYHSAADWRKWWEMTKGEAKKPIKGDIKNPRTELVLPPSVPRFFGKEVVSRTPVFVIDTSGSMNEIQEVPVEEVEEAKRALRRGWRTDPVKKGEEEKKPKPPVGKTIKMPRIDRAKLQLKKMLSLMDPGVKFNIIAYDMKVHIFNSKRMVYATPANKKKAFKWVDSLTAQGPTHMDEGCEVAWRFVAEGCDAIYVLADGWPTHTGDPKRDGDILEEKILKFFRKHNFLKKVVVHTLGFKGAHRSFLKKLAKENGGTYKDIK